MRVIAAAVTLILLCILDIPGSLGSQNDLDWKGFINSTKDLELVEVLRDPRTNNLWLCGSFYQTASISDGKGSTATYSTLGWSFFLIAYDNDGLRVHLSVESSTKLSTHCSGLGVGENGKIHFLAMSEGKGSFSLGKSRVPVSDQTGILGEVPQNLSPENATAISDKIVLTSIFRSTQHLRLRSVAKIEGVPLIFGGVEFSGELIDLLSGGHIPTKLVVESALFLLTTQKGKPMMEVKTFPAISKENQTRSLRIISVIGANTSSKIEVAVTVSSTGRTVLRQLSHKPLTIKDGGSFSGFFQISFGKDSSGKLVYSSPFLHKIVGWEDASPALTLVPKGNTFQYFATKAIPSSNTTSSFKVIAVELVPKKLQKEQKENETLVMEKEMIGQFEGRSLVVDEKSQELWVSGASQNSVFVGAYKLNNLNDEVYYTGVEGENLTTKNPHIPKILLVKAAPPILSRAVDLVALFYRKNLASISFGHFHESSTPSEKASPQIILPQNESNPVLESKPLTQEDVSIENTSLVQHTPAPSPAPVSIPQSGNSKPALRFRHKKGNQRTPVPPAGPPVDSGNKDKLKASFAQDAHLIRHKHKPQVFKIEHDSPFIASDLQSDFIENPPPRQKQKQNPRQRQKPSPIPIPIQVPGPVPKPIPKSVPKPKTFQSQNKPGQPFEQNPQEERFLEAIKPVDFKPKKTPGPSSEKEKQKEKTREKEADQTVLYYLVLIGIVIIFLVIFLNYRYILACFDRFRSPARSNFSRLSGF